MGCTEEFGGIQYYGRLMRKDFVSNDSGRHFESCVLLRAIMLA